MTRKNNTSSEQSRTLLESGMGIVLNADEFNPDDLADLLSQKSCVLVKGIELDHLSFTDIGLHLGELVHYEDQAEKFAEQGVLSLNSNPDPEKVITGRGPLPLHTDGLLMNKRVDFTALYCVEQEGKKESGATQVCDQLTAWDETDEGLKDSLHTHGLEYQSLERAYFPSGSHLGWLPIDLIKHWEDGSFLNIALPFPEGYGKAWNVRVKGVSGEESDSIIEEIGQHLNNERYTYSHHWQPGDFLIFDNRKTLHGRSAIKPGSDRNLMRIQMVKEQE